MTRPAHDSAATLACLASILLCTGGFPQAARAQKSTPTSKPASAVSKKTHKAATTKSKTPPKKAAKTTKAATKPPLKRPLKPIPAKPKPAPAPTPRPPVVPPPIPTATPRPVPPPALPPPPAPSGPATAQIGTAYTISGCQVTIEKAEFTTQPLPNLFGPNPPDDGTRYILFTINIRNSGTTPVLWGYERFHPALLTSGGGRVLRGAALLTTSNKRFELQPLQSGEEKTLHFHFQVPLSTSVTGLTIGETDGHPQYFYDLSNLR